MSSGEKLPGEQAEGCYQGRDLRKLPETHGLLFYGLAGEYWRFYCYLITVH